MNLLHAVHDFLPRHQAGAEIHVRDLARALQARHDVTVLAAEYDPARQHGTLNWRVQDDLPVIELVNNWVAGSFEESYRSAKVGRRLEQVLDAVQPDVLHVHGLLNLSFDLPALARARGIPVVATLHDYTLVCASGGQRVHRAESHVCHDIESTRCARCFGESPFARQMSIGPVAAGPGPVRRTAAALARRWPAMAARAADAVRGAAGPTIAPADIERRLAAARGVFDAVDLLAAPSAFLAEEFVRLGVDRSRLRVIRHGFPRMPSVPRLPSPGAVRFGFVGTPIWHKGLHVLVEATDELPPAGWSLDVFGSAAIAPGYVRELQARVAGRPVRFRGDFTRDRLADVFAALDVLVVPSIWLENSPLVVHEAFQAGVPVVASRMGGLAELVRDNENGLLYDAGSPRQLGIVLRQLVERPGRVRELAGGLPAVKSIDDNAREWESVYDEVMARGGRTGRP